VVIAGKGASLLRLVARLLHRRPPVHFDHDEALLFDGQIDHGPPNLIDHVQDLTRFAVKRVVAAA
jgi:hypothetical protein